MTTPTSERAAVCQRHMEGLPQLLSDIKDSLDDPLHSDDRLNDLFDSLCNLCNDVVTADITYASKRLVEDTLWTTIERVKDNFQRRLRANENFITRRGITSQYHRFINRSIHFYRDIISRLGYQYGDRRWLSRVVVIPGVRSAISELEKGDGASDLHRIPDQDVTAETVALVSEFICQSIVHMGDIVRYLTCERLRGNYRLSIYAMDQYKLASSLFPEFGVPHGQLASLANARGHPLGTLYHLYRFVSTRKRYLLGQRNLVSFFEKIDSQPDEQNAIGESLATCAVRLHSECYRGAKFGEHSELETQFLTQLAAQPKGPYLDGVLQILSVINIAAESFASYRSTEQGSYWQSQRLNLKTFSTLLEMVRPELARLNVTDIVANAGSILSDSNFRTVRCLLPSLRLYSAWFTKAWPCGALQMGNVKLYCSEDGERRLWTAYAQVLTQLIFIYNPAHIISDDILPEDIETTGFQPLCSAKLRRHWYRSPGQPAPGQPRSVTNDTAIRIRDILMDGIEVTQLPQIPITFLYSNAVYWPVTLLENQSRNESSVAHEARPADTADPDEDQHSRECLGPSDDDDAMSTTSCYICHTDYRMNRIVDDLVGPP